MSFTLALVFGKWTDLDGEPAKGEMSLALSNTMSDGSVVFTANGTISADLDAAGTAAVVVPANDDLTTAPQGTYYTFGVDFGQAVEYEPFVLVVSEATLAPLITGSGPPSGGTGSTGDWYLDTTNSVIYQAKTSTWPMPGTVVELNGQVPDGVLDMATALPALAGTPYFNYTDPGLPVEIANRIAGDAINAAAITAETTRAEGVEGGLMPLPPNPQLTNVPTWDGTSWVAGTGGGGGGGVSAFTSFTQVATTPHQIASGELATANVGSLFFTIPDVIVAGQTFAIQKGTNVQQITVNLGAGQTYNAGLSGPILIQGTLGPDHAGFLWLVATSPTNLQIISAVGTDAGGGINVGGILTAYAGLILHLGTITTDYTTVADAIGIICKTNSLTVTLTTAGFASGHVYIVINEGPGTVTLAGAIDTPTLPPGAGVILYLDISSQWRTASSNGVETYMAPIGSIGSWSNNSVLTLTPGQLVAANIGIPATGDNFLIPATISAGQTFAVVRGSVTTAITIRANTGQSINGGATAGSITIPAGNPTQVRQGLIILLATTSTSLEVIMTVGTDFDLGWTFGGPLETLGSMLVQNQLGLHLGTVTSNYATATADLGVYCNSATPFTVTLTSSAAQAGRVIILNNIGTGTVTITPTTGTIDVTSIVGGACVIVQYNGTNWYSIAEALPTGTTTGTLAAGDDSRIVGAASAANLTAEITRAEAAEATNATAISTETTRAEAAEALLVPIDGMGAWAPQVTEDGSGDVFVGLDYEWAVDTSGNWWYDPVQTLIAGGATPAFLGPGGTLFPLNGVDAIGAAAIATTAETVRAETAETALATSVSSAGSLAAQKASNGSDFADKGSTRANLNVSSYRAKTVFTALVAASGIPAVNDGYQCVAGDVVLLTDETTLPLANGLWVVGAGTWTRPTDMPVGFTILGRSCVIEQGTVYGGSIWTLNQTATGPVIVNTTTQTWVIANQSIFDTRYGTELIPGPTINHAASPAGLLSGYFSPCNSSGGAIVLNLPAAPPDQTRTGAVVLVYGSSVVLTCGGSDHFNLTTGPTTYTLIEQGHGVIVVYTAATALWTVIDESVSPGVLDGRYDATGAAAAAQAAAQTFATGAVATETTRAEAAEALLAPLASPALTGTPTTPTPAALDATTKVGTTAYTDSAVGVEKTRALAAEATLLSIPTGTAAAGKVPVASSSSAWAWNTLTAAQVTNAADKSTATTQAFTAAVTCAGLSSSVGVGGTYTSATGTAPATGVNYMIGSIASGTPSVTGALLNEIITSATGEMWICTVAATTWWNVRNVVGTTISAQAIVSGTKFTPSTTQDVELVVPITLGGTLTYTMGPSTGAENSILPALTAVVAGTIITKRIPRNWGVIITLVTATIANATKQTL